MQRVEQLRKQAVNVTAEHFAGAKKLLDQHNAFEAAKDKDVANERKALAKDVAGFVHNQYNGVGVLFHGFGEGKRTTCEICKEHQSSMYNQKDGRWYCAEHRWFGNLS